MKKLLNIGWLILFFVVGTQSLIAQNKKNNWIVGVEVNAVDVFPVGEDDLPQGSYFSEFFNAKDHWNFGFPKITVSKYMNNHIYVSIAASFNNLTKWGELDGIPSAKVNNLKYIGLDGMVNYYFLRLSDFKKIQPFIGVGGGYTWIKEGRFNTFSTGENTDDLVGAGTVNGTLGANFWINERIGLNIQTTYKHSFEEYLTKHWQHSAGLLVIIAKSNIKKKEKKETDDRDQDGIPDEEDKCPDDAGLVELDGCPDSDGDGIADKDDLCPTIYGLKIYDGCVDTDGDGYSDNIDDCPDEKGTLKGCPEEVQEAEVITPYCFEDLEDMDAYFASLKRDGEKEVEGLIFKVQIGAYRKPLNVTYFDFLKDVGPIEEIKENGLNKFRLGDYKTLLQTEAVRKNVIEQGVSDAFVIAFFNGLPITMEEAVQTLCVN